MDLTNGTETSRIVRSSFSQFICWIRAVTVASVESVRDSRPPDLYREVMTERRYSDEEVAAIFERATKSQAGLQRQHPEHASAQGMTLGELQQIGRDVGIPDDLVASAAREIDVAGRPTERKYLGLP